MIPGIDRTAADIGGASRQAFTRPLIDQNGNFVFYEIMTDPNEISYLTTNALHNINGQVAFTGKVGMPGSAALPQPIAILPDTAPTRFVKVRTQTDEQPARPTSQRPPKRDVRDHRQ
jgi:hypothetical protein